MSDMFEVADDVYACADRLYAGQAILHMLNDAWNKDDGLYLICTRTVAQASVLMDEARRALFMLWDCDGGTNFTVSVNKVRLEITLRNGTKIRFRCLSSIQDVVIGFHYNGVLVA